MPEKIVDFHAHAFDEKIAIKATENLHTYYNIEPVSDGRLCHLLESAQKNHVDKLVLCATATKPTQVQMINNYVSGLIGEHVIGFGTLHCNFEALDDELIRMKKLGLSGIKFHPVFQGFAVDDDKAMQMFEKIGNQFPILMHMGDKNTDATTPKRLANVMKELPQVTFIAAHMGGVFEWKKAQKYLVGKNVYFDTSSSVRFMEPDLVRSMIKEHGADKILFGTDYPLSNHAYEMKQLEKLNLTQEEYEKIYWKNAYRLLHLK